MAALPDSLGLCPLLWSALGGLPQETDLSCLINQSGLLAHTARSNYSLLLMVWHRQWPEELTPSGLGRRGSVKVLESWADME